MRVFLAAKDAPRIRKHPRRGGMRLLERDSKGGKKQEKKIENTGTYHLACARRRYEFGQKLHSS